MFFCVICYNKYSFGILYRVDIKRIHVRAIMKILQGVMTMIPEILLAEDDEQIREAMTDFLP